ncbi:hypothetical protein F511_16897 [Dorcoceras hygrometricum]|uniref:Uncharacterized protein n=1 Tax=Dorcoceras hygrometricum TaxID=472368 RepID=A0A2Z7B0H2_9LAMI|nr:hypothetical protein F511_16897 [Dorcoceras hygrometricum]
MSTINTSSDQLLPIQLPTAHYLHSMKTSITDSACKNQLVVVSIRYGPFNPYIPIRSTIIGKSRVAKDPIAMRTSWRSNSDIASVTRAHGSSAAHSPFLWGPSLLS